MCTFPSPPCETPICVSQVIMKDRWMNVGFEDEELKPYIEPEADLNDQARIRESSSASSVLYSRAHRLHAVACTVCTQSL